MVEKRKQKNTATKKEAHKKRIRRKSGGKQC